MLAECESVKQSLISLMGELKFWTLFSVRPVQMIYVGRLSAIISLSGCQRPHFPF